MSQEATSLGRTQLIGHGLSSVYSRLAVHSLTWLLIGNGIGMLLASLLLVPSLGDYLTPLTYGRWMPLHLELQLYGWCSLPLVGLLWRLYGLDRKDGRGAHLSLWLWSTSLAVGALSWLFGAASGKLFLSWTGGARLFFLATLIILACLLAWAYGRSLWVHWRTGPSPSQPLASTVGKGLLLLVLAAVPWILFQASEPSVYPPINPDSGGATGGSLLGSTLGIVLLLIIYPHLLGGCVPTEARRSTRRCLGIWGLHLGVFALLDHGDHSHHEPWQIVALLSLVIWLPLLIHHLRCFSWSAVQRRWLAALTAWGALLLLSGGLSFLPGVLEQWKFTHALVAHAHIAMAGLVTSWNVSILGGLMAGDALQKIFGASIPFALWHGGGALMIATLMLIGILEGRGPGYLWQGSDFLDVLLSVRWLAGLMMVAASWSWWRAARGITAVAVSSGELQTMGAR